MNLAEQIMANISSQAAAIGELQDRIKAHAMIYQSDAKEEVARFYGQPLNAYYDYSYMNWCDVWAKCTSDKAAKNAR